MRHPRKPDGVVAPNYTQIPNAILDSLGKYSPPELLVILTICRMTFGWHQSECSLSVSGFMKNTGLSRPSVTKALAALQERGLLSRCTKAEPYSYSFNVHSAHNASGPIENTVSAVMIEKEPETTTETATESASEPEPAVVNGVYQVNGFNQHPVVNGVYQSGKPALPPLVNGVYHLYKERNKERIKKERGTFSKPSVKEISDYMTEIGWTAGEGDRFFDYYESNGWRVGKNPMRDWKATVRQWRRRESPAAGAEADWMLADKKAR